MGAAMIKKYWPTTQDLERARQAYEENEPRDLFYRIARELTTLAIQEQTSITLSEALASLLQTWNKSYYRFRRFDTQHFHDIEDLIEKTLPLVMKFRQNDGRRSEGEIVSLFAVYEKVLGPVGAAKCLHLLAPDFFPLWDRAIAKKYGLPLRKAGDNADLYVEFLNHSREQRERLGIKQINGRPILKAIDEYNYVVFTSGIDITSSREAE
jgi:hypothetical protein